jgi:hypothetical protein
MNRLKICETKIVNGREVDIYVRDAYGKTHILFPRAEKVIMTIKETVSRRSPESSKPKPLQEK